MCHFVRKVTVGGHDIVSLKRGWRCYVRSSNPVVCRRCRSLKFSNKYDNKEQNTHTRAHAHISVSVSSINDSRAMLLWSPSSSVWLLTMMSIMMTTMIIIIICRVVSSPLQSIITLYYIASSGRIVMTAIMVVSCWPIIMSYDINLHMVWPLCQYHNMLGTRDMFACWVPRFTTFCVTFHVRLDRPYVTTSIFLVINNSAFPQDVICLDVAS